MRHIVGAILLAAAGYVFVTSLQRETHGDATATIPLVTSAIIDTAALALIFWPTDYAAQQREQMRKRRIAATKAAAAAEFASRLDHIDDAPREDQ